MKHVHSRARLLRRALVWGACASLSWLSHPQLTEAQPNEDYVLTREPPPAREDTDATGAAVSDDGASGTMLGKAGWFPKSGGFIIASPEEDYKLRIGFQSATKLELINRDDEFQDRRTFFVLRPILAGNIYKPWIQFWTTLELARNPIFLLDSYVDIKPWDEFGLRLGQQYTPLSRHESYGPQQILFPEWSPVAEYYWTGRDKGATVFGTLAEQLEYWVGIYSGSPLRQFTSIAGNYVVQGRVTYSPMGPVGATEYPYIVAEGEPPAPFGVSFTLQGSYGKVQTAEENFNTSTFVFVDTPTGEINKNGTLGADFFIQHSNFAVLVEGYYRDLDPGAAGDPSYQSVGAWGQVGVLLVPRRLDIAARFNWLDASTDLYDDTMVSAELQFAYYVHAPNVVVKLRGGIADQESPSPDVDMGAVKLYLPAGTSYIGTLQLNLMF